MRRSTTSVRTELVATVVAGILVGYSQRTLAGWTGGMNPDGVGWAQVSVSSSSLKSAAAGTTGGTQNPSASIPPATGYLTNAPLPSGSSTGSVARVKGSAGYKWVASTQGYGGDKTDNEVFASRGVIIIPGDCAEANVETSAVFSQDGLSGVITVTGTATAGTAVLFRGIQWDGVVPPTGMEDLLATGSTVFELLMKGPFNANEAECTAPKIQFTTPDLSRLYVVSDGVAESKPLTITCPADVVFGCNQASAVYPLPAITGGCGDVTVSYAPPIESLPFGSTLVTATATDEKGGVAQCTFTATRQGLTFNGFKFDGCYKSYIASGGSCSSAPVQAKVGNKVLLKFDLKCNGDPYLAGQPTLAINKCAVTGTIRTGNFLLVGNQWQFSWDTKGLTKGVYQVIATLPDGTTQNVFIKLNRWLDDD